MRKKYISVMLLFTLSPLFISAGNGNDGKGTENTSVQNEAEIQWMSFEEAIKKNKTNPKKVFVDVYTVSCGWCKKMDYHTFTDPTIVAYMNANYYAVKFDAEQRESITLKDREFKFIPNRRGGYHELAAALLKGRLSYPTVVVLDEELKMLTAMPGFRNPPELDMMLKFFGGDHHKDIDYATFSQSYKSPYGE